MYMILHYYVNCYSTNFVMTAREKIHSILNSKILSLTVEAVIYFVFCTKVFALVVICNLNIYHVASQSS